jgi:uncharacterized membrane protein HdeD (DUF308 family)
MQAFSAGLIPYPSGDTTLRIAFQQVTRNIHMPMSMEAAAQAYREAVRHNVRQSSTHLLLQAGLMVLTGAVALVLPAIFSEALIIALGWVLLNGFVSILLSVFLLNTLSSTVNWLIAFLVGLQFISAGVSVGCLAWFSRQSHPH